MPSSHRTRHPHDSPLALEVGELDLLESTLLDGRAGEVAVGSARGEVGDMKEEAGLLGASLRASETEVDIWKEGGRSPSPATRCARDTTASSE
jgi:hypothetical protein